MSAIATIGVPLLIYGISKAIDWALESDTNKKNRLEQRGINAATRQAVDYQTALSRQWAKEDWDKQNQYNHPLQQMTRLRQAGLNPNLVYGSGANTTAQSISTTQPKTPNLQASSMAPLSSPDLTGALASMYQSQSSQIDIDNKKAQTDLLQQQAQKNTLEMAGMATKNATSEFQLSQAKMLQDATVQKAILGVQKQQQDLELTPVKLGLQKEMLKLQQAKTAVQIQNAQQDILTKIFNRTEIAPAQKAKLQQEIENSKKSGELRQIDINLRSQGLNPSDPAYMRVLIQLATRWAAKYGINLNELTP